MAESTAAKIFRAAKDIEDIKHGITPGKSNQEAMDELIARSKKAVENGAVLTGEASPPPPELNKTAAEETMHNALQAILTAKVHEGQSTLVADTKSTQSALRPDHRPRWSGRLGK